VLVLEHFEASEVRHRPCSNFSLEFNPNTPDSSRLDYSMVHIIVQYVYYRLPLSQQEMDISSPVLCSLLLWTLFPPQNCQIRHRTAAAVISSLVAIAHFHLAVTGSVVVT